MLLSVHLSVVGRCGPAQLSAFNMPAEAPTRCVAPAVEQMCRNSKDCLEWMLDQEQTAVAALGE